MKKQEKIILAVFLLTLLIAVNYNYLDRKTTEFFKDYKTVSVERVIDGDTIVTDSKEHVRLLGINAPETSTKEKYSMEAKQYLSNLTLNKTVKLEIEGKDLYNRTLAYVFLANENINEKMIEKGFANFYFPERKDEYYTEFKNIWEECIKSETNICEKSEDKCSSCIDLIKLDYSSQEAIFRNTCSFSCNLTGWQIKDEGRKEFVFPEFVLNERNEITVKVGNSTGNQSILFWKGYDYVWTKSGDTLFLRDKNLDLVLWKNY